MDGLLCRFQQNQTKFAELRRARSRFSIQSHFPIDDDRNIAPTSQKLHDLFSLSEAIAPSGTRFLNFAQTRVRACADLKENCNGIGYGSDERN